ncbi:MAG: FtsX-like permease family protein [Candidatus Woesearchaeota archaeon]
MTLRASALFLLRGMRWRLAISLLTVLTSAIAVGAAVVGPLYLRTARDSVLRSTVASASVEDRGATLAAASGGTVSLGQIRRAERVVGHAGPWFGPPITTVLSGISLTGPRSGLVRSQLLSRTGICRALRFAAGTCRLAAGDAAVSARSARELGIALGSVIQAQVQGAKRPVRLRITGIYDVPNYGRSYWWGNGAGYFPFGQSAGGQRRLPEIDSLITSASTAAAVPVQDVPEVTGQLPLRLSSVSLTREAGLRRTVAGLSTRLAAAGIRVSTQTPSLLASADSQSRTMTTIVAVAAVQLVLLAVWVLVSLLLRSGEARQAEVRVARLRGFPPRSLLAVTALEPACLCLLGLLLGIAGAWAAVAVARADLLNRSASIVPDGWSFAALGLTVLTMAGALMIYTVRVLRSSSLSGDQVVARAGTRRLGYLTDAVLVVLSVVALVALATNGSLSGHSNPIASAAPGLIALGIAVVSVHLVLAACRIGVSASANSRRIATFLALRQIVRRPVVLRQSRVLIIAVCLACFAISAWSVARSNRAAAANFGVGASQVVTVTPHRADLLQAVNRVDPGGQFAMAAVDVSTPSSTVLAVESSRLSAVLPWPAGISRTTLPATVRRLDPPSPPSVDVPDTAIRLAARTEVRGGGASQTPLDLGLWLFDPRVGTTIDNLGTLHPGTWSYRGVLGDRCPGGCRLEGLGLIPAPGRNPPTSGTVRLTLTGISVRSGGTIWKRAAADLFPRGWRVTASGIRIQSNGGGSLTFVVPAGATAGYTGAAAYSTPPMASPADYPAVLPAAVTSEAEAYGGALGNRGVISGQGLDGNTLNLGSAVTVSALPRVGGDAAMVDLGLLRRAQTDMTTPYATDQVWLGPRAPGNALARLRNAGLSIDRVQTSSAVVRQAQHTAPALADDFLVVATIIALFAAAASTLGALVANTRQRATELTALEVGGVSRGTLVGSLGLESVVLALTALFGAFAGVLAAVMAIPAVPEFSAPATLPLQYGLPGGLVVAVTAAVVAVVLLTAAAVTTVLTRRMSPVLLRMAPNERAG